MKKIPNHFASVAAILLFTAVLPAQSNIEQTISKLPDIGDPAARALPLSREQKLSDIFVRELRHNLPLVTDLELNEYLSSLGAQLISASPNINLNFHFLLANNAQINAFATLGGVITINSGLLSVAANESELVGVLAHEITHVTQRHLARLLAESQRDRGWSSALALLSIIMATVYGSDAGLAGLQASIALPLEKQISYIRNHEHEADRIGMQLMALSGFHPEGMVNFFARLQRLSPSPSHVPVFLRTHPLSSDRRSEALNQLAYYRGEFRTNSPEFEYAKARLQALLNPDAYINEAISDDPIDNYRRAIALTTKHNFDQAIAVLETAKTEKNKLPVQLALVQAKIASGNNAAADKIMKSLYKLYPYRETVAYYYALVLLNLKQLTKAATVLNEMAVYKPVHPEINLLRAQIALAQKKTWLRHEYMADYYAANGNIHAALNQLDTAMENKRGGAVFQSRIEAKKAAILQLQKDMQNPFK